ncbi:MAG: hypothetical protein U0P81_07825 [Holophagaceae bacterium]
MLACALLLALQTPPPAPATSPLAPLTPLPAPVAPRPAQDPARHLGAVKPGEVKTLEWEVRNASARPATFRLVDPPKAVTAPGLALARPWAPGETRKVSLRVDPAGLRGFQAWTLRLTSPDAPQPDPTLEVDCIAVTFGVTPDTITSLGSLGPREVRTVAWELKNLAEGPMTFRLLDLAPGVTVDMAPFATPFAPGESRPVRMTIDPTGFVGYQRRAAKLECSDPGQPRYILRVDMTVRPELAVDGQAKDLGAVQRFESPSIAFRFTREGGEAAAIRLASELPDYFDHEIVQEGVNASLVLTLRPGRLKPGQTAGLERLAVTTSAPLQPRFNLTLAWRIKQLLEASPSRVVLDLPDELSQALAVRRADGKPFRIREAVLAEGSGWTVAGAGRGELPEHRLTLTLRDRTQRRGMLRIVAEGVEEPLLVPLAYLPPEPPGPRPGSGSEAGPHPH